MHGVYITASSNDNTPKHTVILSSIIQKLGLKTIRRIPIVNATKVISPRITSSQYVVTSFFVKENFIIASSVMLIY